MTTRRRAGRNGSPEAGRTLNEREMEDALRALTPQRSFPELRERVLQHARAALAPPVSWRARLWASWGFRWGWVVGLLLMIVAGEVSQHAFETRMQEQAQGPASASSGAPENGMALPTARLLETEGMAPREAESLEVVDPNPWERNHPLREDDVPSSGQSLPPGSRGALDPRGASGIAGGRLS